MDGLMKSQSLLILSIYVGSSFSAMAAPSLCAEDKIQVNHANNSIMLLTDYNGPVKSVIMTSTIPADGRFKALQGETQFGECGNLLKDHTSMQEYIEGDIETNLIRTSPNNPYVMRFQYQRKNNHRTHSLYMQETYTRDEQNRLNGKTTQYYANDGTLLDTFISQFHYQNGRIVSEVSTSSNSQDPAITTRYTYNEQGKLLQAIEDKKVNVEYQYNADGKVIKQINNVKGIYDEDKAFIATCLEWDKFDNCITEQFESTIKYGDEMINYSKATIYNEFQYYE